MNVMTVGLICIALYALVVAAWLRYDRNRDGYAGYEGEEQP